MDFPVRKLPTRETLIRVQQQQDLATDASGVDLVLSLIATADLIRSTIYARLALHHDLSEGKFILLMSLYGEGEAAATELALRIGVTPATVSVMVKRMMSAAEPLITMSRTQADGRTRMIALSPTGRELIKEALPGHLKAIGSFAEVLSGQERESLISMLRKLLRTSA